MKKLMMALLLALTAANAQFIFAYGDECGDDECNYEMSDVSNNDDCSNNDECSGDDASYEDEA